MKAHVVIAAFALSFGGQLSFAVNLGANPSDEQLRSVVIRSTSKVLATWIPSQVVVDFNVFSEVDSSPLELCALVVQKKALSRDYTHNLGTVKLKPQTDDAMLWSNIPNIVLGKSEPLNVSDAEIRHGVRRKEDLTEHTVLTSRDVKYVLTCIFETNKSILTRRDGVSKVQDCVKNSKPYYCFNYFASEIKNIQIKLSGIGERQGQKYRYADWVATKTIRNDISTSKILFGIASANTEQAVGRIVMYFDSADKTWSVQD